MEENSSFKVLISGSYNVFNEGWDGAGAYLASGNYQSQVFKHPIYIGSAESLQVRIENKHISSLNRNCHSHNQPLQIAWNNHSKKEGFVWWLLESCEKEKTLETEQKWLDYYKPFVDEFGGFNIAHDATSGMKGRKHSEDSKKKMSESKKGRSAWNKGIPLSEERKKHLSQINKGQWTGDKNPSRINPRRGKDSHNYGKTLSEEAKKKISVSRKGIPNNNKKKVICVETGNIYQSITEAALICKVSRRHVGSVCKGKRNICGGFHWKYLNENRNLIENIN